MHLKTTVDKIWQAKCVLQDCYSASESYGSSAEEQTERYLRSMTPYKTLPRWAKSELIGYRDALAECQWRKMVWVLIGPDGRAFGPGNDDWLQENTTYKLAMIGVHVWHKFWEHGETRYYTLPC